MTRLRRAVWLVSTTILAAGALACASSQARARTSECVGSARDSALAGDQPLYEACAVTTRASRISSGTRPDFRPPTAQPSCYSVEIVLVVDTLGRPEPNSARIVRTNNRDFADAVLQTVSTWRYDPAKLDGRAVRQIVLDREMAQTSDVYVRVGSGLPAGAPAGPPPPTC